MKKFYFFALLICGISLASCQNDLQVEEVVNLEGKTVLNISIAESRTALGEKNNSVYPVYWSEGDRIIVNGVASEAAKINPNDKGLASFTINAVLDYPYSITYPYTMAALLQPDSGVGIESMDTDEDVLETSRAATNFYNTIVVIPSIQDYVKGSFAPECAPMCGYAASSKDNIELHHLAGVLRLPMKALDKDVFLKEITITSTDEMKLSGEFVVNCSEATMVPAKKSNNKITYKLPSNFNLSTTTEDIFYIVVPAGNIGKCTVEFIEQNGEKMVKQWDSKEIKAGIVREFKTIIYQRRITGNLEAMESEEDVLEINYPTVYGYVRDNAGNPIKGVAVSDGFNVVSTNSEGYYSIDVSKDTWYIFISLPAEYEIPINEYGQPCFYKKYPSNTAQYDFTLTPLEGGKEKEFALFTFGDPQVSSNAKLTRFLNEAVPGIKAHADEVSKKMRCYGITLGDIISNSGSTNASAYRDDMRDGFAKSKVGLPVFQVMGNHDNTYYSSTQPIFADETSSTFELKAQRDHEDMFGPANYSFNRGDVHIIGMRDIVYQYNTTSGDYSTGFLKSQYEWLKQDLAFVPKDKVVVVCVHIPFYNKDVNYIQDVLKLLNTYKEAHIMSGHTHIIDLRYEHKVFGTGYNNVYEHNVGAVCGAWWSSNMCGDGAPCGYGVFIGKGNTFADWYYIGFNEGMNKREHQMRLYRGNAKTGAAISGTNTNSTKGYYAYNFAEDVLLANIYFADSKWKVSVYEDGVYSGDMKQVTYAARPLLANMAGTGTFDDPFTPKTSTSADIYYTGLFLGILGKAEGSTGARQSCYHMYQYKLKNKNAAIKVVATDRFGNTYTETKITEGTDYSVTKAK